ncbi:tape measure protein [uncultured Oscillibacter sp.]|uniref:tape measure protein n=1 Tax=uncultured Oscillibacter sp. TaxID=876091 RepID=UPI0025DA6BEE|nr:tape measure protein [uncultured Oscillibacter sp.]
MGSEIGTYFSNSLSSIISGASIGTKILPGLGTAIGAGVGAIAGVGSGYIQNFQKRDEAFKSYVQEATEGQISERDRSLAAGSAIAAGRETDKISFGTLFGDQETADQYLEDLVGMSNETPFLYDDLTAMSKTLATYGYDADSILPVLQTVGDAGAALGQSTSDMNTVATAIGRMKSSDKASMEYLNMLNDRGIGAVGMLAEAKGVDQGTMYDMISKGQIAGGEAAEILLQAMAEAFGGSMEDQSKTFSGLTSTVEGLEQELDNAMGEGYNEGRKSGLEAQKDWLSGESGEAVKEANRAIGAWQAELENEKERYQREAVDAMMNSEEYQTAKASGDAAEMGRLIMQAKVQGMNEYNASEGAQMALKSELALAGAIRDDTRTNEAYYDAGLRKSQEFTKGLAEGIFENNPLMQGAVFNDATGEWEYPDGSSHAYGLGYVPYDGYRAVLHQGERVLTAAENREKTRAGGGVSVTISGPVTVRQESDIDAIAASIVTRLEERALLYGG